MSLYRNNAGNTNYKVLQAKLEQRFSRALSFLLSYTRSKLIDEASSVFDASILRGPINNFPVADSFNRRPERDLSNGDIPNVLWRVYLRPAFRQRAAFQLGRARGSNLEWF